MRFSIWTVLTTLLLVSNIICKSLSILDTQSAPVAQPPLIDNLDELEALKNRLRSGAPRRTVHNSLSRLNITIEKQRRMLRQYREKLQELNELDDTMDYQQKIHKKELRSYQALANGDKAGYYIFPMNIAQPEDPKTETKVQSATLNLYRKSALPQDYDQDDSSALSSKSNIGYNTVLLVYQTLPNNMRRLVTSKVISLTRSGWTKIDVTEIAQSWVDEPGMNHGLEVQCTTHNISHILLTHTQQSSLSEDTYSPTLDIVTYEKPINVQRLRRRRDTTDVVCRPGRCCRQPVNIILADVGLHDDDLHSEGESIQAYICNGKCHRGHKLHNFWATIKDTLRRQYPNASIYKNRCTPVSYERSYSHVHYDEDGILTSTLYNDLIVKECACT